MTRALWLLLAATVLLAVGIVSVSIWSIPLGALLILIGGVALVAGVDAVPRHGPVGGPSRKREATGLHPGAPTGAGPADPESDDGGAKH